MQPIDFHLSTAQLKKLATGKVIQLKHAQIGTGIHRLYINPATHKKVVKAHASGKGVRLQLSEEEIEHNGEGFRQWIGKVWKGIKGAYNKVLKPILSPLIRTGLNTAVSAIPGLNQVNSAYKLVDKIGDKTGAFGLSKWKHGEKQTGLAKWSHGGEVPPFMMAPSNGALEPYPDGYLRAPGLIQCPHCGSGFRPAN
jgi:hypothetical protein